MSGGTRIGWHPDVAVVVWRRLLCILGDINQISDPRLHWVVLECLWAIWQMLAKVRYRDLIHVHVGDLDFQYAVYENVTFLV